MSSRQSGVGSRQSAVGIRIFSMVALLFVGACGDWFTTFARQPVIHPWQAASMTDTNMLKVPPRGNPKGSVSLYGQSVPEWVFSYSALPPTLDSMGVLVNPREPNEESISKGHRLYQMNCAVCHGDTGTGDGASKWGYVPIPLLSPTAIAHKDGTIFGIIRNGKGTLMPSYNRIEAADRWDVVNYVRGLQGKLGRAVPTGPLGTPGETGTKIPGASETAPQRQIPHFPPSKIGAGGGGGQ